MDVVLFSYKNRKSILHRIPSVIKLFVIIALCFICFTETSFEKLKLSICFLFSIFLFFLGRGNLITLKPLIYVFFLGAFVTLLRMFNFIPEFSLDKKEFFSGIIYTIKLFITTLACQIIFETTSNSQIYTCFELIENTIAKVFSFVKIIKKNHIALLISLSISFIPLIFETWQKVHLASKARSLKKRSIFYAIKIILLEMESLLSCLINKADIKRKAIESKMNNLDK